MMINGIYIVFSVRNVMLLTSIIIPPRLAKHVPLSYKGVESVIIAQSVLLVTMATISLLPKLVYSAILL